MVGRLLESVLARRTGTVFAIREQSADANQRRRLAATLFGAVFEIGGVDFQICAAVREANLSAGQCVQQCAGDRGESV